MEPLRSDSGFSEREGGVLIIGIGNEFRSDDALGILVVREIARRGMQGVALSEQSGEGTRLMEAWKGARSALIIDAVSTGTYPGCLHRLDASREAIPKHLFHYSSHAFGVAEAIALGRQLGELPPVLLVYGIEGESFEAGIGLNDAVICQIPALITMIQEDVRKIQRSEALS